MTAQYDVRLVGGEMLAWSDADGEPPGGEALRELVGRAVPATAHVLVAGPHRVDFIDALVGRFARVTCLLRSFPDAQELGRRHADSGRLTVLCGALDKLTGAGDGPFDAIVAPGGLTRLGTPDGSPLTWAESMERLTAMLGPEGTLVLGVDNDLGVHRLSDPETPGSGCPDGQWLPGYGADGTVPADPAELMARAREAGGGVVDQCYAAYPGLSTPGALLSVDLLAKRLAPPGAPATLIAAALADGFAGRALLTDPRRLTRDALVKGLGAALAPGWIVVMRRGPEQSLPVGIACDGDGDWSVTWELKHHQGAWVRSGVRPVAPVAAGRVLREPGRLSGPVPSGRSLEEILLDACAHHDLAALRRTLRGYTSWVADQVIDDEVPGALVFATAENVVADGDRFALLDPSWELAEPVPLDLHLGRVLRRFASRLLATGHRHPWPTALDLDGIAVTLLAMAGRPADRGLLSRAVRLEAEIIAAREGLVPTDEARLIAELESGSPRGTMSHREALLARRTLAEELAQARDRAVWLEARTRAKEAELQRVRDRHQADVERLRKRLHLKKAQLAEVRRSPGYRMTRMIGVVPRRAGRAIRGQSESSAG